MGEGWLDSGGESAHSDPIGRSWGRTMKLRMATCLALCLFWETRVFAQEPPIQVSPERLASQRLSGESRIRSDQDEAPASRRVDLDIIVGENGAVVAVEPVLEPLRPGDSERYRDTRWTNLAGEAVRQWRYRPFLRDGRERRARGRVTITMVPRERVLRGHTAFPEVRREEVTITLTRSICDDERCPAYSVTIGGDGRTRFVSLEGTLVRGAHVGAIPVERVEQLIARFRAADFWSLRSSYWWRNADSPTVSLTFAAAGQSWTIVDHDGTADGMPDSVTALQDAVDEAADTGRWVRGNERTIAALDAEGFDFGSEQAARLVDQMIGWVPDAQILALIDRGAWLGDSSACSSCLVGGMEIVIAAAMSKGRLDLVNRLLAGPDGGQLEQQSLDRLLVTAAGTRSPTWVGRLLARGANPRGANSHWGGSALIFALRAPEQQSAPDADREAVVRMLLGCGADLERRDPANRTALQYAEDEDPAIARLLIAAGANVDAQGLADAERREPAVPPLLYLTDDEEVALVALRAGADRRLRNAAGETLAQIAWRKGWRRVAALLRR
jgi:hypothetical protein